MATLDEIRAEILETAGLASDDPRFPDATMTKIVNRALRQVSAEHDWPWNESSETITTVADTQAYSPAAGWQKTIRLRYEDRDLVPFQGRESAQFHNNTGAPVGYFIEKDQIHFVPVPDGAYSIDHVYSGFETALSGDSDTPSLPDRYLDWLVHVALIQVAAKLRDPELYGLADRERRRWYARASDEVRRSTAPQRPKARGDWTI